MIDYFKGSYGLNLLFRVHGSSLYKGSLVGLLSVLVFLAIVRWNETRRDPGEDLDHPYGVGVLISGVSWLIIFRANYGYQRYWEAVSSVHHFMSKVMDATQHAAVFHLQNSHYDGARPPSFFDHDELNRLNLTRDRKRSGEKSESLAPGGERRLASVYDCEKEIQDTFVRPKGSADALCDDEAGFGENGSGGAVDGTPGAVTAAAAAAAGRVPATPPRRTPKSPLPKSPLPKSPLPKSPLPKSPLPMGVRSGRWDIIPPTPDNASSGMLRRTALSAQYFPSSHCPNKSFACRPGGKTPPLFLQELAHLSSLAMAVSLSTLRNDVEYSESPLDMHIPGSRWPPSDPDNLPGPVRKEFQHRFRPITILRHWSGRDRLPHWRSKYNAARPLLVLGGVSYGEIQFLQKARGPQAKAQLALAWLKEFIVREHLEGSLGEVHSAIISRLVQFLSDGILHYHQARKIMYIPFPFPHAQVTTFFAIAMVLAVPFVLDSYTNDPWAGGVITFMAVTCLVGLHEVARELENPFRNVPNEIPLCTLQAMYNEALLTMFSGYNPDSFWDAELYQGAMEAAAMGKIYEKGGGTTAAATTTTTSDFVDEEGILAMEPLAEEPATEEGNGEAPGSSGKKVTFAPTVETSGDDDADELRETLARQALEIEELERLLDDREEGGRADDASAIGSILSSVSLSFSKRLDDNN